MAAKTSLLAALLVLQFLQGCLGQTCLSCESITATESNLRTRLTDAMPDQTNDCRSNAIVAPEVTCEEGMICAAVYMEAKVSTSDNDGITVKYWWRNCSKDATEGNLAETTRCHDMADYNKALSLSKQLKRLLGNDKPNDVTGSVCLCDAAESGDGCNNKKTADMVAEAKRSTTGKTCIFDCAPELPTGLYQSCKRCDVLFFCQEGKKTNLACRGNKIWNDMVKKCRYKSPTCTSIEGMVDDDADD